MERSQQVELKKEAFGFLALVLCMAVALGHRPITDNRTVTPQNTCHSVEDELKSLPFNELQDLMQFHVNLEQYEEAAKLRDLIRKKYGHS